MKENLKIIVGLGNPEDKYKHTRHNIGKDFLNYFANLKNVEWQNKKDLNVEIAKFENAILVKPGMFMNELGVQVGKCMKYFEVLDLNNLMIVYDDLDFISGDYKLNFAKGSKIHNGLNSVIETLGSNEFWHLRIGVREEQIPFSVQKFGRDPAKYVLDILPLSDSKKIKEMFDNSLVTLFSNWLSKN